jgi:GcrA cell cycle regulator
MSWTDERIDLLQKLWLQGMSASRIARELANGLTRNAVIGKVYRLGLSGRVKETAAGPGAPRPLQRQTTRSPARQAAQPGHQQRAHHAAPGGAAFMRGNTALAVQAVAFEAPARNAEVRRQSEVVVPMTEPVTILELRDSMCKWPIGDPTQSEFRFCGARKTPGDGPYCGCHAAIAYQPQPDRRRQRQHKSA